MLAEPINEVSNHLKGLIDLSLPTAKIDQGHPSINRSRTPINQTEITQIQQLRQVRVGPQWVELTAVNSGEERRDHRSPPTN